MIKKIFHTILKLIALGSSLLVWTFVIGFSGEEIAFLAFVLTIIGFFVVSRKTKHFWKYLRVSFVLPIVVIPFTLYLGSLPKSDSDFDLYMIQLFFAELFILSMLVVGFISTNIILKTKQK